MNPTITKPIDFKASAGSYFVTTLVGGISLYVPIIGWTFGFNYVADWYAKNAKINGQTIKYQAGFGETTKFILINLLLLVVTFGIYMFWFYPKMYSYFCDHISYDGAQPQPASAPAPSETTTAPIEQITPPNPQV